MKDKSSKPLIPKVIWIYWEQGFENAPFVVKKCVESWQKENPVWKIYLLDKQNIGDYITLDVPKEKLSKLMLANKSDLIRLKLLQEYGGVWVDATTYCMQPLDSWIEDVTETGFFVFHQPGEDRLLSTWFIASEKNAFIVMTWYQLLSDYWKSNNYVVPGRIRHKITHKLERLFNRNTKSTKYWFSPIVTKILKIFPYFAVHYLFERLVSTNKECADLWKKMPKLSADDPHKLLRIGLQASIDDTIKNIIDYDNAPLYKLTYRNFDSETYHSSLLHYLFEERFKGND